MNWGLFESFCEMLKSIPTKAVLRAVEAERRMVEEDLEHRRTECDQYVISSVTFSPWPFAEATLRWQLYPSNIVSFMGKSYKGWWMRENFRWDPPNILTAALPWHSTPPTHPHEISQPTNDLPTIKGK